MSELCVSTFPGGHLQNSVFFFLCNIMYNYLSFFSTSVTVLYPGNCPQQSKESNLYLENKYQLWLPYVSRSPANERYDKQSRH